MLAPGDPVSVPAASPCLSPCVQRASVIPTSAGAQQLTNQDCATVCRLAPQAYELEFNSSIGIVKANFLLNLSRLLRKAQNEIPNDRPKTAAPLSTRSSLHRILQHRVLTGLGFDEMHFVLLLGGLVIRPKSRRSTSGRDHRQERKVR